MSWARLLVGDVRERIRDIEDGSVDLVLTSPPFYSLRDYGGDSKEMGRERTPAAFLDGLLSLTAEFRRILSPFGSIAIELGDTYSGSGGSGGDYAPGGLRDGQRKVRQVHVRQEDNPGGPLAKSLFLIPGSYATALAYGWNPLAQFGNASPAGKWRVRNVIAWARPNPARGALGDKVQPATSYITVACVSVKRYFDLDAIRTEPKTVATEGSRNQSKRGDGDYRDESIRFGERINSNDAGVPPLDYWTDDYDEDDPTDHFSLMLSTQGYDGAHFATWPKRLCKRLIAAMCPLRVCSTCEKPSRRHKQKYDVVWSDCGHNDWRAGVVLDPFAGSGTTLAVAQGMGRSAVGIELYDANAELIRQRVGMFLDVM